MTNTIVAVEQKQGIITMAGEHLMIMMKLKMIYFIAKNVKFID